MLKFLPIFLLLFLSACGDPMDMNCRNIKLDDLKLEQLKVISDVCGKVESTEQKSIALSVKLKKSSDALGMPINQYMNTDVAKNMVFWHYFSQATRLPVGLILLFVIWHMAYMLIRFEMYHAEEVQRVPFLWGLGSRLQVSKYTANKNVDFSTPVVVILWSAAISIPIIMGFLL